MSNRLLESDFLTVNLSSITRNQQNSTNQAQQAVAANSANVSNPNAVTDWAEELKKRLADNSALGAEARESDFAVKNKFVKDYFTANWEAGCAKQLELMGSPLKKAIEVLGFNPKANPILGFITNEFVIDNLIKTKLLNANTFRAIYNAVANKYTARTQFFKANTYNVIYCQDLYTKPLTDIEEYLKAQSKVLQPSGGYSKNDIQLNRKIFFGSGTANVQKTKEKTTKEKEKIRNKNR